MPATLGEAFKVTRSLDFSGYTRSSDLSSLRNPNYAPVNSHENTLLIPTSEPPTSNPVAQKAIIPLLSNDDQSVGHVSDLDDLKCEQHLAHLLSCTKCRRQVKTILKITEESDNSPIDQRGGHMLDVLEHRDVLIYVGYGIALIILLSYFRGV